MAKYTFDYSRATDVQKLNQTVAVTLDEVKAWVDQILDNLNIDTCPVEHMNIIANLLGYPINKEDDPDFIRRSLKNAINLYKSKGTEEAIKVIFYNLGFNVEVVPLWTPDFVEQVAVYPPYLEVKVPLIPEGGLPYNGGYYDITVINPDDQMYTTSGAYQFIDG
jgi:phage tail P2-like protein